jgi:Tfp pilus assembly protein PilV
MEVNMAVFVMAIGILGMVALFPLGLREGVQARADLKQSMFADHALNQLVAILSQTNMTWQVWEDLADGFEGTGKDFQSKLGSIGNLMPKESPGGAVNLASTLPGNWTIGVGSTAHVRHAQGHALRAALGDHRALD